jgi:hypothetical protein
MGTPVGIALFGAPKVGNIFPWGWDGGENSPERGLGMGTVLYPPACGDSVPENFIKITFINVYLSTL